MFENFPRQTVYAHRGSSAHAPETTLAAFELAGLHQADAIELDAELCADHHIVVIHDLTVDRTTNGTGKVSDLTLPALRELDAGSSFSPEFKGEKIPTLEEVFETVGKKLLINVELKNYSSIWDDLPVRCAELVKKCSLVDRVIFSSFNPVAIIKVKKALPAAPAGLLTLPGRSGAWGRSWLGRFIPCEALHPEASDVTEDLIRRVHTSRRRVNVWTVDEAETIRKLFSQGVDGVITNDPIIARQALNSLG